ncbi:MoaD/ThiS family protein [Pseudomarimonas salicorniae]|uniref:MoaD/ThiS family protein n=1 Tax=Pseudomarimonas salicorniae TaxID=2933270 RepID=A0ABT0GGJ9_9GAMM|nr:MoaD/ThiS family protein [Lysobacter sp. CAU 1642]MCK7593187.1 MoaD/ThiS family protein [Lysobacter sp. CAU 1642]
MPTVTLALHGACRELHPQPSIEVELDAPVATVGDLRRALPGCFPDAPAGKVAALLQASAFASDEALLRDGDPLPGDGRLAILPPVSGG